jgi:BMFP domain-containing protein YqiC
MLDPKQFDEFARRISESLPSGLREFQQEVERNARTAMQSAFARMDLVTREEFDAQAKVLLRTREKLEALEARLAKLEGTAGATGPGPETGSAEKP